MSIDDIAAETLKASKSAHVLSMDGRTTWCGFPPLRSSKDSFTSIEDAVIALSISDEVCTGCMEAISAKIDLMLELQRNSTLRSLKCALEDVKNGNYVPVETLWL